MGRMDPAGVDELRRISLSAKAAQATGIGIYCLSPACSLSRNARGVQRPRPCTVPVLRGFATSTVDGSYLATLSGAPSLSIGATPDEQAGSRHRQAPFLRRILPIA